MQVPLGQAQGNQAVTPAIMMVAPQPQNQTNNRAQCWSTKKAQIVLGSVQIILGILAIVFNVSIFQMYCRDFTQFVIRPHFKCVLLSIGCSNHRRSGIIPGLTRYLEWNYCKLFCTNLSL